MPDQKPDEIAIFAAASELGDDAQAAFLDEACQGDRELRDRMASYLRCDRQTGPLDVGPPVIAAAVQQTAITDRIGSQIGPYTLFRQLGQGGMGVVYEAEQRPVEGVEGTTTVIFPWNDDLGVYERMILENKPVPDGGHPDSINESLQVQLDYGCVYTPGIGWELLDVLHLSDMNDFGEITGEQREIKRTFGSYAMVYANGAYENVYDERFSNDRGTAINNSGDVAVLSQRSGLKLVHKDNGTLDIYDVLVGDPADVEFFKDRVVEAQDISERTETGYPYIVGVSTTVNGEATAAALLLGQSSSALVDRRLQRSFRLGGPPVDGHGGFGRNSTTINLPGG